MQSTIPSCLITVLSDHPLTLADAGAAGGIHQRWLRLGGYLKVLGFEPDHREFDLLAERSDRVWINAALGEQGDGNFAFGYSPSNQYFAAAAKSANC